MSAGETAVAWVLGIVGLVVFVVVIMLLAGVLTVGGSAIQGETDKQANPHREKSIVFDPNRTLSTYEGFYDKCNLYNATVNNAADALDEAEAADKRYDADADTFGTQREEIEAKFENARGIRSNARNIAADYNADSSANTRAPFKAAELPYTLPTDGESPVECGTAKEGGR